MPTSQVEQYEKGDSRIDCICGFNGMCPIGNWCVIDMLYTLVLSLYKCARWLVHRRWPLQLLSFHLDPSQLTWRCWWHVDPRYSHMVECVSYLLLYYLSHAFMTAISLGLIWKVIARMKTMRLPWPTQFGQNELLRKLPIDSGLGKIGHYIFLPPLYLFSTYSVDSHWERQHSKGMPSSPVTDRHSQQSDLSGEHQGDVQGDDEEEEDADKDKDEDERRPQNGSPFAERQNLLPRHQCVCQPSAWHQSHSPIATEWSCHPHSPSTCHFQSSLAWPSRQWDEFSHQAQGSHRHHDQASSHRIPLLPSPPCHNLVRQYGQWTSSCCFVISLIALFLLCFLLSYLGFISAHTVALYFASCICCICLMLP